MTEREIREAAIYTAAAIRHSGGYNRKRLLSIMQGMIEVLLAVNSLI